MATFQLLGCEINIGADRTNSVVRDQFDPITYPELLILRALHGGEEHVHSLVAVGTSERDVHREFERLENKYGKRIVNGLFPGAVPSLPLEDPRVPTLEEVHAGETAAKAARKIVREQVAKKPKPDKNAVPDLTS